ncbi:MAG: hypothetical protein LBQ18_04200 [Campylobacteraceae bacterium]|nr:hypothetical protein [Campylobacteraceae bacterium]
MTVSCALFFGCAAKEDIESLRAKQAIINTQKARLSLEDNSTLLITATYLNKIKRYSQSEFDMIALSFYYSKEGDVEQLGEPNVKVGQKSANVTKLSEDDEIVGQLPIRSAWSNYFLVSAPKSDDEHINLTVEIYPFERVVLRFPKAL